jgi:hypothetical protein
MSRAHVKVELRSAMYHGSLDRWCGIAPRVQALAYSLRRGGCEADDLVQSAALNELARGLEEADEPLRLTAARQAMLDARRREQRRAAHVDAEATTPTVDRRPLQDALLDCQRLRRCVRARLGDHARRRPHLLPAVPVVLGLRTPRDVAVQRGLPVHHVYQATEALREHLRADGELQQLWIDNLE